MDTIANMLTTIKNAQAVRKVTIDVPASTFKNAILKILKEKGYIKDAKLIIKNKKGNIKILLAYQNKKGQIEHIKRISKPGLRVYVNYKKIPRPLSGLGLVILSTPKGVLEGEEARRKKTGGEIICEIY